MGYFLKRLQRNMGIMPSFRPLARKSDIGPSIITALREVYKNKKYLPLDMRPKKTRAIRRRLTKHQVIRPFILRRKKDEVEKFLPGKTQALLGDLSWLLAAWRYVDASYCCLTMVQRISDGMCHSYHSDGLPMRNMHL
ncbi:hypothetical protein Vadar_026458 [Vaccinium darrowii]|uniref:Uncharacterized protein n=1 Tax=Vaccinium darrowii TaxID=229202 RepID=A0ACB7Y397_9ERIC|nr:hypothetical protein Vadar_026458 [Vaccinium darrowii]